tara:strand:+ start:234 stop:425 length:192 start_codon:yes stop_codon:yes gene_type:complete
MARSLMRKFREVKKKDGVPVKYTAGAANPEARRAEIKRTAEKYRKGTLTKAEMNRISRQRSKS